MTNALPRTDPDGATTIPRNSAFFKEARRTCKMSTTSSKVPRRPMSQTVERTIAITEGRLSVVRAASPKSSSVCAGFITSRSHSAGGNQNPHTFAVLGQYPGTCRTLGLIPYSNDDCPRAFGFVRKGTGSS
eukprot:30937-Pelagococcus_subviridis.AAC.18